MAPDLKTTHASQPAHERKTELSSNSIAALTRMTTASQSDHPGPLNQYSVIQLLSRDLSPAAIVVGSNRI